MVCVECGYNLTGNISGTCPECGTPIARHGRRDERYGRERRRELVRGIVVIVLAGILCGAVFCALTYGTREDLAARESVFEELEPWRFGSRYSNVSEVAFFLLFSLVAGASVSWLADRLLALWAWGRWIAVAVFVSVAVGCSLAAIHIWLTPAPAIINGVFALSAIAIVVGAWGQMRLSRASSWK